MRHVLLDCYGIDARFLEDEAYLRAFLAAVPEQLGMQAVSPVYLENVTATSDPRDAGCSGFVIIATSHVSLHAWPPYGMLNLDCFSCNEFDPARPEILARAWFQPSDVEKRSIERAKRSPRPAAPMLASCAG